MDILKFLLLILLISCNEQKEADKVEDVGSGKQTEVIRAEPELKKIEDEREDKTYANARFKNVLVKKTGTDTYRITGEGQIFEASFNWVVEDGHNELTSGYATTDAGAPAWGKFDFVVKVSKQRPNSTLQLLIYEASAKDGSRQHELPIRLE